MGDCMSFDHVFFFNVSVHQKDIQRHRRDAETGDNNGHKKQMFVDCLLQSIDTHYVSTVRPILMS